MSLPKSFHSGTRFELDGNRFVLHRVRRQSRPKERGASWKVYLVFEQELYGSRDGATTTLPSVVEVCVGPAEVSRAKFRHYAPVSITATATRYSDNRLPVSWYSARPYDVRGAGWELKHYTLAGAIEDSARWLAEMAAAKRLGGAPDEVYYRDMLTPRPLVRVQFDARAADRAS